MRVNKVVVISILIVFYSCTSGVDSKFSETVVHGEKIKSLNSNDTRKELVDSYVLDSLFNSISLVVPSEWKREFLSKQQMYTYVDKVSHTGFKPNFNIQCFKVDSMSLSEFSDSYMEEIKNNMVDINVLNSKRANIHKNVASSVVNFTSSYKNDKLGVVVSFNQISDNFYVFTGTGLNNIKGEISKYMVVYDEVIWSFKPLK